MASFPSAHPSDPQFVARSSAARGHPVAGERAAAEPAETGATLSVLEPLDPVQRPEDRVQETELVRRWFRCGGSHPCPPGRHGAIGHLEKGGGGRPGRPRRGRHPVIRSIGRPLGEAGDDRFGGTGVAVGASAGRPLVGGAAGSALARRDGRIATHEKAAGDEGSEADLARPEEGAQIRTMGGWALHGTCSVRVGEPGAS